MDFAGGCIFPGGYIEIHLQDQFDIDNQYKLQYFKDNRAVQYLVP